ncbi:YcaO-like family protein [Streptomyces sp. NPDC057909]|uniref:YcaO-like family protein n=1 Tax=Streptomyces sp. NPDC057909 TaxID=3346277 RepID=UPI0036E1D3B6
MWDVSGQCCRAADRGHPCVLVGGGLASRCLRGRFEGDVAGFGKRVTVGTHRAVPAAETWTRVAPLLPLMGITRVADLTCLDVVGIPVFQAVRPNGRTLSVSQGKGVTAELARVSAVMESIETWHAEEAEPGPVEATVTEMAPLLPYSVFDLPRPPRSVLSSATRLRWVAGRSVGGTEPVWLPQACVRLDSTDPGCWSPPVLSSNSNGLASGNTLEEALLHGLYEVLERDAMARVGQDRAGFELDLTTVTGTSASLLERYATAEVQVRVHDVTSVTGLPCYEALLWSPDLPVRFSGWGCHRDADVALTRALTEAAQSRLTMVAGTRDDLPEDAYHWVSSRSRLRAPFPASRPARTFPLAVIGPSGLDEDLQAVAERVVARTAGGVFWVDLTRPEFGIPVVQVVAPGLQILKDYR